MFWEHMGQNLPCKFRNIQHIQHIQHFRRKKHFFQNHTKSTFNIFNITAERRTFSKKMILTTVMLNVVVFLGFTNGVCKFKNIQHFQHFPRKKHIFRNHTKSTFNIFNITAERSIFSKLYLSKKAKNCGGKWPHRHIHIHVCVPNVLSHCLALSCRCLPLHVCLSSLAVTLSVMLPRCSTRTEGIGATSSSCRCCFCCCSCSCSCCFTPRKPRGSLSPPLVFSRLLFR